MMRILWRSRSPVSDGGLPGDGLPGILWRAGRLLKSAGWFALVVLFISVGVFKVLVEFFRLLEGTWFWVFAGLVLCGMLLQWLARRVAGPQQGIPSQHSVDAGTYVIENDRKPNDSA